MPDTYKNIPSNDTTVGSGDGSETSVYNKLFGLVTMDGSGNPPDTHTDIGKSRLYYDKDLDLVQNMRNVFSVVGGFKETLDNIIAIAGSGALVWMTTYMDPEERIRNVYYLGVHTATDTGVNKGGHHVTKFRVQMEDYTGNVVAFFSDADIVYYDNSHSYELTSNNVAEAIDELSNRSIIKSVIVPHDSFVLTSSHTIKPNSNEDPYSCAEVNFPDILSTDYPVVTLAPMNTTNQVAMLDEIAQAGHISRIETLNGKIKVYCHDGFMPSRNLRLVFRILRGGSPF